MSFRAPHELHQRRFGLNLGLGLVLGFLVAVVFGLTVAKVSVGGFVTAPSTVGTPIDAGQTGAGQSQSQPDKGN